MSISGMSLLVREMKIAQRKREFDSSDRLSEQNSSETTIGSNYSEAREIAIIFYAFHRC